jgi:uncharacterized protein YggE
MSDEAMGEMPTMRTDPDMATVVKIVGAGTSTRQPGLYEIHLEVRPERAGASTNLVLVFQNKRAEELLAVMKQKPPMAQG